MTTKNRPGFLWINTHDSQGGTIANRWVIGPVMGRSELAQESQ